MKSIFRLGTILIFSAVSLASAATETFPIYAGLGYGLARYVGDEVNDPQLLAGQKAEGDRGYYEAYVGIDLGEVLSVELAYAAFNTLQETYDLVEGLQEFDYDTYKERVEFDRFSIMAVAEYPLMMGFTVYATGGYAYYDFDRYFLADYDSSASEEEVLYNVANGDHGLEYGFGFKWEVISRLSVRGHWAQSMINDRKVQSNRLSVEFHF